METDLVIKNGQIYNKAGEKQTLEFGNKEQIKVLRKYEARMEALRTDGLVVSPDVKILAEFYFNCSCGKTLPFQSVLDSEDDYENFVGDINKCNCGQKYKLGMNEGCELVITDR